MDADVVNLVEKCTSPNGGERSKSAESCSNTHDDSSDIQASSTTSKPAPLASTSEEAESTRNEASSVINQQNGVSTPEQQEVTPFRKYNFALLENICPSRKYMPF